MAPLGKTSMSRLDGAKTVTVERAIKLAAIATTHGGDIGIPEYGGYRSLAMQTQLFKWREDSIAKNDNASTSQIEGNYAVAAPGKSKHESGDAFDIRVLKPLSGMSVDQSYKFLADMAPALGLRAGYYFKPGADGRGGSDPFHFENAEGRATSPVYRAALSAGKLLALIIAVILVAAAATSEA